MSRSATVRSARQTASAMAQMRACNSFAGSLGRIYLVSRGVIKLKGDAQKIAPHVPRFPFDPGPELRFRFVGGVVPRPSAPHD
jgi:hypothetical protein